MRRTFFCLLSVLFLCWAGTAQARTTATFGQNSVGTVCNNVEKATDFDTIAQCNSGTGAGTMQTAPIIVGAVTAPPYATTTCDANKAGMIQWTGSAFQGCDGTSWVAMGGASTGCNTPNAISFTDQTGVALNTTITSNAVTLSGAAFTCVVAATCTGCTAIMRNGVASGTSTSFMVGDTVALRLLSSSDGSTVTASVKVGTTTSATWSVTPVDPCAGSPTPGTVCGDGTVFVSSLGGALYTTRCDAGKTWSGSACTGTQGLYPYDNGWYQSGGGVYANAFSGTDGRTNTNTLVALGTSPSPAPYTAARYCDNLVSNGKSDWYLPASNAYSDSEMQKLYTNRVAIGNFGPSVYWTSSEGTIYPYNYACAIDYNNSGNLNCSVNKSDTHPLRCVRK